MQLGRFTDGGQLTAGRSVCGQNAPGWVDGLDRAARALRPPLGQGFTWIAAETAVAKHLRKSLMEKGFDNRKLRASGYWKQRAEATHDEHGD
jgi:NADPH-dependent ferric siderophore reductase